MTDEKVAVKLPPESVSVTPGAPWWTNPSEHGRMVSFRHPEHGWVGFSLSEADVLKLAALLLQGYA